MKKYDATISVRVNRDVLNVLREHNINISDLINTTLESFATRYTPLEGTTELNRDVLSAIHHMDMQFYKSEGASILSIKKQNRVPIDLELGVMSYLRTILKKNYDKIDVLNELQRISQIQSV